MLYSKGASTQSISFLNRLGLCVSPQTLYRHIGELAAIILRLAGLYRPGKLQLVYDNNQLPDTPKISLSDLTPEDILPSSDNFQWLKDHVHVLIPELFSRIQKLAKRYPRRSCAKTSIIPLPIIDKAETTRSGTVKILEALSKHLQVPAHQDARVAVHGDGLTMQNILAAFFIRCFEHYSSDVDQFKHFMRVFGDFHRRMAILCGIIKKFSWCPSLQGTFAQFCRLQNKTLPGQKFPFYEMEAGMRGAFHCYLAEMVELLIEEAGEQESPKKLFAVVLEACMSILFEESAYSWESYTTTTKRPVVKLKLVPKINHPFQNYIVQFITLFARYEVYYQCIKHADGEGILRLEKIFLPFFKKFCPKYCHGTARELIEHLSVFSQHDSKLILGNKFLNSEGKPDSNYEVDLGMEYIVKYYKQAERAAGTNRNWDHTVKLSLVSPYFHELSTLLFKQFGLEKNGYHRDVDRGSEYDAFRASVRKMLRQDKDGDGVNDFCLDDHEVTALDELSSKYLFSLIERYKTRSGGFEAEEGGREEEEEDDAFLDDDA
ncbi:hypothetical protein HDU98_003686 [Podochytrium sp. JEL0797]|nr:hypothetical protein HDU98_003686 [Podochytrium sp. JEL0797]